jgi:hypothetical protein
VEVARTSVITETFPEFEYIVERGLRQLLYRGKGFEKTLVVG